jgi:hypothetical protein
MLYLTTLVLAVNVAYAAITMPLVSVGDAVQQNSAGTWCYYPKADRNLQTICRDSVADFQAVIDTHLSQTISISYYDAALNRVGGAEWLLPTSTQEKTYLCLSGRAGDGSYETSCELSRRDNVIHGGSRCTVAVGQREVSDGCYVPGLAVNNPTGTFGAVPPGMLPLPNYSFSCS